MRIIAGNLKGRKLATPQNDAIRPTVDRMREAVFNLLMHGSYGGQHIREQRVMDLCSGTGAVGLEAISRGAAHCTFVDQDKTALGLAKENAVHCKVESQCQFLLTDATKLPSAPHPVALAFMDAPYATPLTLPVYAGLRRHGWLLPESLFVVEQPRSAHVETLEGAECLDQRDYGKARLIIYRII